MVPENKPATVQVGGEEPNPAGESDRAVDCEQGTAPPVQGLPGTSSTPDALSASGALSATAAIPRPSEPFPEFSPFDGLFAFLTFLLGYAYVALVFFAPVPAGLSVTVFALAFFLCASVYFHRLGRRWDRGAVLWLVGLLLLALYFPLSDNRTLSSLALAALTVLAPYWALVRCGRRLSPNLSRYTPGELLSALFIVPFSNFSAAFRALFLSLRKTKRGRDAMIALLGLVLAVPLCAWAVSLLLAADPAFAALLHGLFDGLAHGGFETAVKLILAVPVACYFFGLLSGAAWGRATGKVTAHKFDAFFNKMQVAPALLCCATLLPLLLVYMLYFVSQLTYFLSAFQSMLPEGFTYAEYARQGFFELSKICLLNLAVLLLVSLLSKARRHPFIRGFSLALSAFTLLFIATALSKMILYVRVYGLTEKRLYTTFAMAFLACVFLLLIFSVFRDRMDPFRWIYRSGLIFFALLLLINPDALIARSNVGRYLSGDLPDVDVQLLSSLSSDAVPSLLRLSEEAPDGKVRAQARQALPMKADRLLSSYRRDWKGWSLPEARAARLLQEAGYQPFDPGRYADHDAESQAELLFPDDLGTNGALPATP